MLQTSPGLAPVARCNRNNVRHDVGHVGQSGVDHGIFDRANRLILPSLGASPSPNPGRLEARTRFPARTKSVSVAQRNIALE